MKMTKKCFFLVGIAVCLMSACNEENGLFSDISLTTMTATFEEPETKADIINGGSQLYWEVNDEICVFYALGKEKYTAQCKKPSITSMFKGKSIRHSDSIDKVLLPFAHYLGWYPYSEDAYSDGADVIATLPDTQTARENLCPKNACIAMADVPNKANVLKFHQINGELRFSLTREGVKKIKLRSVYGEMIAGTCTFTEAEGFKYVRNSLDGKRLITLLPPEEGAFSSGKWYSISTLPVTMQHGFQMYFYSDDGLFMSEYSEKLEIKPGGIIDFADVDAHAVAGGRPDDIEVLLRRTEAPYTLYFVDEGVEVNINNTVQRLSYNALYNYYGVSMPFAEHYMCGYPASFVSFGNNAVEVTCPKDNEGKFGPVYVGNDRNEYLNQEGDIKKYVLMTQVTSAFCFRLKGPGSNRWNSIVVCALNGEEYYGGKIILDANDYHVLEISDRNSSARITRDYEYNYNQPIGNTANEKDYQNVVLPVIPQIIGGLSVVVYDAEGNILFQRSTNKQVPTEYDNKPIMVIFEILIE